MLNPVPPLWADFRLVEHKFASGKKLAIHRAYYYDIEMQNLYGIAPAPAIITGAGPHALLTRIDDMLNAFERHILVDPPTIKNHRP